MKGEGKRSQATRTAHLAARAALNHVEQTTTSPTSPIAPDPPPQQQMRFRFVPALLVASVVLTAYAVMSVGTMKTNKVEEASILWNLLSRGGDDRGTGLNGGGEESGGDKNLTTWRVDDDRAPLFRADRRYPLGTTFTTDDLLVGETARTASYHHRHAHIIKDPLADIDERGKARVVATPPSKQHNVTEALNVTQASIPYDPQNFNFTRYSHMKGKTHVQLYPMKLSDYRHTYGNCRSSLRYNTSYSTRIEGRGDRFTRLWPNLPDRRTEFATEHERCHAIMIRQLAILTSVLDHYNITNWFISHSTLLGAIRHGGFIPWDVDVDVVMSKTTTTFLRRIWRREFPRDMFLQSEKTDREFHLFIGNDRGVRIKDRYSGFHGFNWRTRRKNRIVKQKRYQFGAGLDIIPINRLKDSLRQRVKVFHNYFNLSDVFPTTKICFENIEVRAPKDPEWFLDLLYGPDWRQKPAVDAEFSHPTAFQCLSTTPELGSRWNLDWRKDHPRAANLSVVYSPKFNVSNTRTNQTKVFPYYNPSTPSSMAKLFPRADPHGVYADDMKRPYMAYKQGSMLPRYNYIPNDSNDQKGSEAFLGGDD